MSRHGCDLSSFLRVALWPSVMLLTVELPEQYQQGHHEAKFQLCYKFGVRRRNPHSDSLHHHAHKLKHLKLSQVSPPPEVLALLAYIFSNDAGCKVVRVHDDMHQCVDEHTVPPCM